MFETRGATSSFPLPLGASLPARIYRGHGLARRLLTGAPVPAWLPIPWIAPLARHPVAWGLTQASRQEASNCVCDHTRRPPDLPNHQADSVSLDKARNSVMIDLSKATKGRRMSRKPHKRASRSASTRKSVAQPLAKQTASPGKTRSLSARKPTREDGT